MILLSRGKIAESSQLQVNMQFSLSKEKCVEVFVTRRVPFIVTLTPDARNNPPKRLLKIWLPSRVAVAWLVISIPSNNNNKTVHITELLVPISKAYCTSLRRVCLHIYRVCLNTGLQPVCRYDPPAAKPSNILFFRSTGWLLVLMSTPAWAFLKMSFSSNKPKDRKRVNPTNHIPDMKIKLYRELCWPFKQLKAALKLFAFLWLKGNVHPKNTCFLWFVGMFIHLDCFGVKLLNIGNICKDVRLFSNIIKLDSTCLVVLKAPITYL